jgi:osmotically-inducible protein OsmY
LLTFTIPSFAYTNSYTGITTISSTGADPAESDPSESDPTSSTPANGNGSWQQSASEAVRNAEAATEKAYNQFAENVANVSLEARIMAVLHENKATRDSDVGVTADNGIVTLTGQVVSAQSAQRVQDVVANVYGVKAVNNYLKYPGERGSVTPPDADSTGVAHPAYSDTAPAEKAPAD